MASSNNLQAKSDYEALSPVPSLCDSNESRTDSSVESSVGASQLDRTTQYIPIKYSLDRYAEDFRSDVHSEFLMGYTWANDAEAVTESEIGMERYIKHASKPLLPDSSVLKDREINSFVPSEGTGQLTVFPARKRLSEGEMDTWDVSDGRKTTQPRRSKKNPVGEPPSKRPAHERAMSDRTSIVPDAHSSKLAIISPAWSPAQVEGQILPDRLLTSSSSSSRLLSPVTEMPQPSSLPVMSSSYMIDNGQLIPMTIPDALAGQEQGSMMAPSPSIERINEENTTIVFKCKSNIADDRYRLTHDMIDATPTSPHKAVSAYGDNEASSASNSLSNIIWPSVPTLPSQSSSEWNIASPLTSITEYSMDASLDKFDSDLDIISLPDREEAYKHGSLEDHCNGPADDWTEFLTFPDED